MIITVINHQKRHGYAHISVCEHVRKYMNGAAMSIKCTVKSPLSPHVHSLYSKSSTISKFAECTVNSPLSTLACRLYSKAPTISTCLSNEWLWCCITAEWCYSIWTRWDNPNTTTRCSAKNLSPFSAKNTSLKATWETRTSSHCCLWRGSSFSTFCRVGGTDSCVFRGERTAIAMFSISISNAMNLFVFIMVAITQQYLIHSQLHPHLIQSSGNQGEQFYVEK